MKWKLIMVIVGIVGMFLYFRRDIIVACPFYNGREGGYCSSTSTPRHSYTSCSCNYNSFLKLCTSSCTTRIDSGDSCEINWAGFGCTCAGASLESVYCNTSTCKEEWNYKDVSCGGGCSPSNGSNGACGSANGGTYETYPTSNLCNSSGGYTWVDSVATDGIYNWNCNGTTGSCGGNSGSLVNCSAYKDNPPILTSLVLKTYDGDTVVAETGDRNQMCQSIFTKDTVNPTGVQFVVTASDVQGTIDIGNIQVRLLNASNTYTFTAVASTDGIVTVPVDLKASGVANGTYNIQVLISDATSGVTSYWIDTGRDFKYWDCKVSVVGSFYDGSDGESCPDFGTDLALGINFTSLSFVSPTDGLSSSMMVNSDSTYTSSDPLIWGTSGYKAILNNGLAMSNKSLKLIDMGTGSTNVSCNSTLNFDLNSNVVNPYSDNPQLRADFSGIISQEAWFQTINGGVLSSSILTNYVPLTCGLTASCTEATSIRGLVAAPTINGFDNVPYSSPDNWYIKTKLVNKINYFEKYKKISGVGTTLIEGDLTDSNIINNANGLLMVNGNVTISQGKAVPSGSFSMIVASGDINIDVGVTRFDGILVGNNINIGGTNTEKLTINGSLYGTNLVNITRSYTVKQNNNYDPAVVIKFRPDFIFNMPSSMAKSVIDWKWGN